MYMTLHEKYNYINDDFKKSALYLLGELPEDHDQADDYFQKAIKEASAWLLRYKDRGADVYRYAYSMANDYMESIEREYRRRFIGGTNVRNRKTKTAKN